MHRLSDIKRSAALAALLLLVAAAAAMLATGAFAGAGASPPAAVSVPSPESAAPEGGTTTTPTDVTSSFAAFQRAGTPQDRAIGTGSKALSILATAQQESGVNPSLARLMYQSATSTLALVPGKGVLCLLEEAQSISAECMSAAEADSHGI